MRELPTGTVTFLFTDIEGSTRLLQELGDRYASVQDEHAAIVSAAVEEEGGTVVRTEGDSFFAAFPSPRRAVEAAVASQRRLDAHGWSHGGRLRVRMGIHTGEGVRGGGDYVGIDVNRAARIADAAHGGQIVLSEATRGLVEHALPDGVTLRDLGEHRLKDLAYPDRLHDIVIAGLPSEFPALRTVDARPKNLPLQLTSFVGREHEIAEATRILGRTRLLTLTGAGGSGKTRLALEVAAELLSSYEDGVFFADLSAVTDPTLVPSVVGRALDIPEVPGRPLMESMKDHLRDRELLLVLDNFEQVVDAAPIVEELLTASARLTVIVTSRTPLGIRGEHERLVPPFQPPDPDQLPDVATLRDLDAVRLFTERAVAVSPRFEVTEENAAAVAEILARLDGLPLAIELAATRVKLLTPGQMLERLEERLDVVSSGGRFRPERQRTLRAAIGWSYDLLQEPEQRLFARLSVFAGGWTLESVGAVCEPTEVGLDPLDGLTSLVNTSLVRLQELPEGEPRFSMLATVRSFASEKLQAAGEEALTRRRHGERFLDLALEAEPHLLAADQRAWLDRCDREHANLRAALRWAIRTGETARAQEAAGALWRFWQQRGHLAEGRRWFEEVLALPEGQGRTPSRAKALTGAGGIAWWQADVPAAAAFYEEALSIERELGDQRRIASALYDHAHTLAARGDIGDAVRRMEEGLRLSREVGDEVGVTRALWALSLTDVMAGEWQSAIVRQEEAVRVWRRLGHRFHLANGLASLGVGYGRAGRWADAKAAVLEALDLFTDVDDPTGIASVILDLAFIVSWKGRHEDAVRLAGAWQAVRDAAGGGPPSDFLGTLVGDPIEEAKAALPQEVAQRAFQEGRALTVEDAVLIARALAGGLAPTSGPPRQDADRRREEGDRCST